MKSGILFFVLLSFVVSPIMAQQEEKSDSKLPYQEIPESPENYSSGNVVGRMIDGLGYRYYWATEGIKQENLGYKPSEEGRSIEETITHIYGLSLNIVNAPQQLPNVSPTDWSALSFEEKRKMTLENLQKASDLLKESESGDMKDFKIVFQSGDRSSEFPFWNMINGPIADAIYHTGQLVVLRRSAGNPVHPGVNVFIGKTRGL